jgi:hypothetical protein
MRGPSIVLKPRGADLANQRALLLLLGIALNSCSDSAGPSPGTFQAQLTGARVASLSGSSNAARSFTQEFPDLQFAIGMYAPRGDTIQTLGIRCRGDQPPALGVHTLDESGEDCIAGYSRVLSTSQGGTIVLESAEAISGTLTIETSQPSQMTGTFSFRGTMLVDADSVGILQVSGSFSADVF